MSEISDSLPALGSTIAGRYRLTECIGMGGMGAVYKAEQLGLGRDVALKLILPEKAAVERARKRFLREAKVTSAMKHGGVVQIYDYGDVDGALFIAMELLSGPTLRSQVDFDLPPLSQSRAVEIAAGIAEVLDATARVSLVHRDLKPENVLFDTDVQGHTRVVLVDFGLAFATEGDDTTGRLTKEGVLSGTPDYMSPEQCRGDNVTPACDVYALGCMLYEMLTSSPPFQGEPAVQLSRHLFVPPKSMRKAYPDLNIQGSLDDLVLDMLTKDPTTRPTAAMVLERLERLDARRPERMGPHANDEGRVGRAARMISAGSVHPEPASPLQPVPLLGTLLWMGPIHEEAVEALAVAGVVVLEEDQVTENSSVDAVFAPGASAETIGHLAQNHPVVGTAQDHDIQEVTALLRAGASEALPAGYTVSDLVRRIQRVIRRGRRGRR